MDASNDGSESVDQFLARIASLSSKQSPDDAQRSKRSEEEMLQARKERQARRAERARSLSPSKTGPSPSLRPLGDAAPKPTQGIEPPVALTPPLQSRTLGRSGSISPRPDRNAISGLDFSRPLPPAPVDDVPSMPSPPSHASSLSRSGTLSWQQRPGSRGPGPRSRPLSVASIPDLAPSPQGGTEEEKSRKDIAAALGAKDPTWFRQTADRGIGSAAYRKNEADLDMAPTFSSRGMRLPGMSKDSHAGEDRSSVEPEEPTPPASPPKSGYALPMNQRQTSNSEGTKSSRPLPAVSSSPTKSPSLDLPSFKPLDLNTSFALESPGLGRTPSILSSSGRPPSPTKGLGGFVESAMMKRSDSVSKRWSVQANAGLKRGDSIASTRPAHLAGMPGFTPGHGRASSRDVRGGREGNSSPLSSSRPVSSHGDPVPISKDRHSAKPTEESQAETSTGRGPQAESNEPSEVQEQKRPVTPPTSEPQLSRSPSKTLDSRRWSPTKASWLESALNKPPESPKFTPAKPEVPAWRLSMQRAKQEQQAQSTEGVGDASIKPIAASQPLNRASLKSSTVFDKPSSTSNATKLGSNNAGSAKAIPDTSRPQNDTQVSKPDNSATDKKDEKPVVPSKRNVTPIQLGSSSAKEEETETIPPSQTRQETPKQSPDSISPEPKEAKGPPLKPKPQTPPKTDFRASLKSRQAASGGNNDTEPEFKAVFGKLKRTQTQNYVAPDMLKDNITKGKAALNITGGPQKTKRVDEFKESILQKKEAMKSGSGTVGKRPEATSPPEKPADPVPEALAKRLAMQKTGPSSDKAEAKKVTDVPYKPTVSSSKPEALVEKSLSTPTSFKPSAVGPKPQFVAKSSPAKPETSPPSRPTRATEPDKSDSASTEALSKVVSDDPASMEKPRVDSPPEIASSPGPGFKVKLPENSKLAARLNPALAGILSRSSSPKPAGDGPSNGSGANQVRENTTEGSTELTHATKARAKGPKRRAPKGASSSTEDSKSTPSRPAARPTAKSIPTSSSAETIPEAKSAPSLRSLPSKPSLDKSGAEGQKAMVDSEVKRPLPTPPKSESAKPVIAQISLAKQSSITKQPAPAVELESKPKPPVAIKSEELRKVSNPGTLSEVADQPPPLRPKKSADLRQASSKSEAEPTALKPNTPKKIEILPDKPKFVSSPPESDAEKKAPSVLPLTPNKSKLNTPKAPKPDADSSTKPPSVTPSKPTGLGLQLGSASRKLRTTPVLTPPPDLESGGSRLAPSPRKPMSPTKSTPSVLPQLESFFGVLPQSGERAEFDTHAFLSAQNKFGEKSKTLSKQIWEVSGDGKKIPMPPQQDHILYEDCMYLCVHSMQVPSGSKSSEVYLWCGDEVPEAAVEDAQLFCRKVARDNNAKLEVVKQGKESSDFFQALGGIVIVRRNKSSALYMLCGRRHLGHLAFDEVDLSADSLCSGLPFLISAKFGKLYLWKGKGSNLEDVGCAKLIGMDLGLTGEIEEVSQGEEPASFWESLPSESAKSTRALPISQGGHISTHAARLYRVEHDRPKSSGGFWGLRASSPPKQSLRALVEEVAPFSQKDLDVHHIHILDTYEELYVLVGDSAKKPAEFVTALQIAQEIAVLSPSVQDRPLLPACYLVMGDPPRKIQSVFRKWRSQRSRSANEPICVRVEEVMRDLGIPM